MRIIGAIWDKTPSIQTKSFFSSKPDWKRDPVDVLPILFDPKLIWCCSTTIVSQFFLGSIEAKHLGGQAYARSACWEIILRAYIFQLRARGWRKKQIYLCFWFKLVNFFLTDLKDMCGWGWDKWVLAVDKRYGVFQTRLFHWVSPVPRLLHWVILVNAPLNPPSPG